MDLKKQTIDTYNKSAKALTDKFNSQSGYSEMISSVFSHVKKEDPVVLEIGCGNGRDAEEILKHTKNYTGLDVSDKLLEFARRRNPSARFIHMDIEQYSFEKGIDVVFAFASFIHVPKDSLKKVLTELYSAMNPRGCLFATLKWSNNYEISTKTDDFGTRTYYLYSEQDVKYVANGFELMELSRYSLRGQEWLRVELFKPV